MQSHNVLLINLASRPSRLIHALTELRKVDLAHNVTRIEATDHVDAEHLAYNHISDKAMSNILDPSSTCVLPNYASVGCAVSHINCWKYIINTYMDDCFIAEDDVEFVDPVAFKIEMSYMLESVKKNTKPLFITFNSVPIKTLSSYYGGFVVLPSSAPATNLSSQPLSHRGMPSRRINRTHGPFTGMHFYYINRPMCEYLVNYMRCITYQIDIEIGLFANQNQYAMTHMFMNYETQSVTQSNRFESDIQYYTLTVPQIVDYTGLPCDVARIIYSYLPDCFKKSRCQTPDELKRVNESSILDYLATGSY